MTNSFRIRKAQRGAILISALAFTVISAMLVTGMLTVSTSYFARTQSEADYERALALAEAGVNYEFRKISQNTTNADQRPNGTSPGVSYNLGGGTFAIYCANSNNTTPWTPPGNLIVYCTGTINGISRQLQVTGKGYSVTPNFALFGVQNGLMNGAPSVPTGDVGTNGSLNFNGDPTVGGHVDFNGAGSGWSPTPCGSYNVQHFANPVGWPTVSAIASQTVAGGLATLATTNDNALATSSPSGAFTGTTIFMNGSGTLTLHGKAGGANYYVTSLLLNGSPRIVFDNSAGPINLWEGPAGASSAFIFNGGSAAIRNSVDPTKKVSMYIATNNDVIMNGNTELDAGVYNYQSASSGNVIMNGSPAVYGSVIANRFTMNGSPTINYQSGYFQTSGNGYYGFNDQWLEQGGTF